MNVRNHEATLIRCVLYGKTAGRKVAVPDSQQAVSPSDSADSTRRGSPVEQGNLLNALQSDVSCSKLSMKFLKSIATHTDTVDVCMLDPECQSPNKIMTMYHDWWPLEWRSWNAPDTNMHRSCYIVRKVLLQCPCHIFCSANATLLPKSCFKCGHMSSAILTNAL